MTAIRRPQLHTILSLETLPVILLGTTFLTSDLELTIFRYRVSHCELVLASKDDN